MKQIIPGLYYFTGLIAGRVYCINDADGLTLIDASVETSADKIITQVLKAGYQPHAVKRILITHAHPDHVGAAPKLKQLTGAKVYASAIDKPVIQGEAPVPSTSDRYTINRLKIIRQQATTHIYLTLRPPGGLHLRPPKTLLKPTSVDYTLEDGDAISVFGGLVVIATPGHSPGHLAFWQPNRRVLFCGDVLLNTPHLMLPPRFLTVDTEQNKQSVRRIAELNPEVVCFGHGNPLTQNAAQTLHQFVTKL